MTKMNCWEFKKCGREPGGAKTGEMGVCPAAVCEQADTVHGGKKGGRACWAIVGTLCGGKVQGSFAMKCENCMQCEFYKLVMNEEGKDRVSTVEIIAKLK